MPVSLSASELAMIECAAAPLDRTRRDAFIGAVLAALEGCPELGPGVVHRVIRKTQRQYWDPPSTLVRGTANHHAKSKLASGPPILASARR
jgi:hypothetical protein